MLCNSCFIWSKMFLNSFQYCSQGMKLTSHFHICIVPKVELVEPYLPSPMHLNDILLNDLSSGPTLSSFLVDYLAYTRPYVLFGFIFTVWENARTKWSERISQSSCIPPHYMVAAEAVYLCVYGILFGSICTAIIFTVESCVCVCLLFWSFCVFPLANLLAIC